MCPLNGCRNMDSNYQGALSAFHEYIGFDLVRRLLYLLSEFSDDPEDLGLCLIVTQLLQLVYLDLNYEYEQLQLRYGHANHYDNLARAQQDAEQQGRVQTSSTQESQGENTNKEDNKDKNNKISKNEEQGKKRKLQQDNDIDNDDWKKACNKYWKDRDDDDYDKGGPSNGNIGQFITTN